MQRENCQNRAAEDQARHTVKSQIFQMCGAIMCRNADELRNEAFFTLVRTRVQSVLQQLDNIQNLWSDQEVERIPNSKVQLASTLQDFSCQTDSFADLYAD